MIATQDALPRNEKLRLSRRWALIGKLLAFAATMIVCACMAPLADAATITVGPTTLPNGQVGTAYSQTLTVSPSGNGPYTWTVASGGSLPAGLSLSSSGNEQAAISGTPTAAGDPSFTIQVTDSAGDTGTQTYTLTIAKGAPTIAWSDPADITYGTALSATQLNATADVPGTFTYSPAAGTLLDAGNAQTLSVLFTPTDGFNYMTATASVTINVAMADSSTTVASATGAFDQEDVTLKATVSSTVAVNSGTVTFTVLNSSNQQVGTAFTSATVSGGKASVSFPLAGLPIGDYFVDASYGDSPNFNPSTASGSLTVHQATPTIEWHDPAPLEYGTPLGSAQLSAIAKVPGTFTYNPDAGTILDVGQQELSATFTPQDTTDYTSATVSVHLDVIDAKTELSLTSNTLSSGQSSSSSSASGRWITTFGNSQVTFGAHVSAASPVNDGTVTFTVSSGGTFVGDVTADVSNSFASVSFPISGLTAGSYHVSAVFQGSSFFARSTATGLLVIKRTTPVITWSNPADISYGTPLSSTQLNATAAANGATLSGSFRYGPPSGTVLPPGTAHLLRVTFLPTDIADYTGATTTVLINVTRASTTLYLPPASASRTSTQATLIGRVSSAATVNAGSVTFTISSNGVAVGSVSASVVRGVATASFRLNGLTAGSYTVDATYSGSPLFASTTGSGALTLT
jgi:hypothetical protein